MRLSSLSTCQTYRNPWSRALARVALCPLARGDPVPQHVLGTLARGIGRQAEDVWGARDLDAHLVSLGAHYHAPAFFAGEEERPRGLPPRAWRRRGTRGCCVGRGAETAGADGHEYDVGGGAHH